MKKLLILLMFPLAANATGILTAKYPLLTPHLLSPRPEVSLFVNEPVYRSWQYQSWTGIGFQQWFITEHYAVRQLNIFKFGLGPTFGKTNSIEEYNIKAIMEVKLW